MSTSDERPTQPLHTDEMPDDPGTAPQEDTMTSPIDTGPDATGAPGPASTADATKPVPTVPTVPSTSATAAPAPAPRPRGMRVGTIVWGLVLAAIGAGVLAWAIGVTFDVELAFIVLVAAAGVLLLAGSLATTLRRRR
jgi:hypothetical protein